MTQSIAALDLSTATSDDIFEVSTESGDRYTMIPAGDKTSHATIGSATFKTQKVFVAIPVVKIGSLLTFYDKCDVRTRTTPIVEIKQLN